MKRYKQSEQAQKITRLSRGFLEIHRQALRDKKQVHNLFRGSGWFELLEAAEINLTWAHFYELPLGLHLLLHYAALGLTHLLRPAQDGEEVGERLLASASESDDSGFYEHLEDISLDHQVLILALQISVTYSLQCLSIYSVSLNEFVERVRQGSDLAFRRAVTIDPTVVLAPTLNQRLAFAVLEDDTRFLNHYRKRLLDPNKRRQPYRELRLMELVIRELGGFVKLSREQIHDLIVERLCLYGKKKDSDTFKALFALIDSWRNESTK